MVDSMENIAHLGYGAAEVQFYLDNLRNAELHWIFVEAEESFSRSRYISSSICFIAGIESSIRSTMSRLQNNGFSDDLGSTLSNSLLRNARDRGLPVHCLIMPSDSDFERKLATRAEHVEIVRVRHNLAHGNFQEYVQRDICFFTPECMRDMCSDLRHAAREWVEALGSFRETRLGI